jgi:hypothetical protein
MDRYARKRGELVLEVLIDPVLGTVVEESVSMQGRHLAKVTHSYVMVQPGIFVRNLTRTEMSPGPYATRSMVIEARTNNVRTEERSSQP